MFECLLTETVDITVLKENVLKSGKVNAKRNTVEWEVCYNVGKYLDSSAGKKIEQSTKKSYL